MRSKLRGKPSSATLRSATSSFAASTAPWKTAYIVLRIHDPADEGFDVTVLDAPWTIVHRGVDAPNAEAAIREVATSGGTYVAVPARSWKPVTVKAETRTVLTLYDA